MGAERPLTAKQQLFIEAYLGAARGNATEAARLAGYGGDGDTLKVTGCRLLTNANVAEAVAARLARAKRCLQADDVLELLTDQATSTMDDFFDIIEVESVMKRPKDPARCDDEDSPAEEFEAAEEPMRRSYPVMNLQKAKDRGKLGLVRKISFNQFGPTLELYSAQSALELLGRHHKLFTDKAEITGANGGPIEVAVARRQKAETLLAKLLSRGISEDEARAALVAMGVDERDLVGNQAG
jgi:phage terminase small subunit